MSKTQVRTCAIAFLLIFAVCGNAQAWWPHPWNAWGGYPHYFVRPYQLEKLPHFAVFPPVYYRGDPVRSSYGSTPFASEPDVAFVRTPRIKPLVVRNPYVPACEAAVASEGGSSVAPLVVRNPYVDQPEQTGSAHQDPAGDSAPLAQVLAPPASVPKR